MERQGKGRMPCAVDFITGPGRTSDIKMDLSVGVHGPYRVWTIVIDD
ncbi:LUD domain-containing protein [Sporomusa carbonis]